MAYEKIGWRDYPDKTTPMSAKNFAHMDEGIFENSVAIGETSKIAKIGDGTCAGAIESCFQSVSDGKAAVAAALTNQGVATANDATFATLAENVETVGTNKYNAGMTDADDRVNTDSVNYQTGYSSGYNAGIVAGKPTVTSVFTGSQTAAGANRTDYVYMNKPSSLYTRVAVSISAPTGASGYLPCYVQGLNGSSWVTLGTLGSSSTKNGSGAYGISAYGQIRVYFNGNVIGGSTYSVTISMS